MTLENQIIEVIYILDFYIYTLYKAKYQNNNKNANSFKKSSDDNENENDDSL